MNNPNAKFALLINGKWGSGKTYYWKNHLRPLSPAKTYYVSLFGISTIDEINNSIFVQHLSHNRFPYLDKIATATYFATSIGAAYIKNEKSLARLKNKLATAINLEGCLICFDDFERTSVETSILVGFINNFIEHSLCKVVILCDENEIKNKEEYTRLKEKIIGQEIQHAANYRDAMDHFINQYNSDSAYFEFIKGSREEIIKYFSLTKTDNLRLAYQSFHHLQIIFNKLRSLGQNSLEIYSDKIIFLLFFYRLIICSTKTHPSLIDFAKNFFKHGIVSREDQTKLPNFSSEYEFKPSYKHISESIADYIETSILDEEKFKAEYSLGDSSDDEFYSNIKHLLDYTSINNDEYNSVISNIISHLLKGDKILTKNNWLSLIHAFDSIKILLPHEIKDNFIDFFKKSIDLFFANKNSVFNEEEINIDELWRLNTGASEEVHKYLNTKYDESAKNYYMRQASIAEDYIRTDFNKFKSFYENTTIESFHLYFKHKLFSSVDANELCSSLINQGNAALNNFYLFIHSRYNTDDLEKYAAEFGFIESLYADVQSETGKRANTISGLILDNMVTFLTAVKQKIS